MDKSAPPAIGQRGKDQGLGGFPGPYQLTVKISRKFFPRVHRWLVRIMTQPNHAKKGKSLQWLSEEFSRLTIYRNSDFDTDELDDDELERLGGLEYRALDFLSYLVIAVSTTDSRMSYYDSTFCSILSACN